MPGINDFVIRFANVNGTGSASANGLVAKVFFKMGLNIGPKNMFPSNIQGLPTWYEIRVSEKPYTGRRGGVDLMIAMNPQTFAQDESDTSEGGYLLYDSTKPIAEKNQKSHIKYLGIPITELCLEKFQNPKTRSMLKNIVYVGALAALLDIPLSLFHELIGAQFKNKPKLVESNEQALSIGYEYAKKSFKCPLPIKVQKRERVQPKIMLEGNAAAGLGCVYAGATVAAWYPITPSTSLIDAFNAFAKKLRTTDTGEKKYAVIQAEDELSAIGIVLGANWMGARSFTATSGPGLSLMQEFLGFAYYAEVPVVLFDVQRVGPSTGMPTRTQQSDLLSAVFASHGDTKHVVLIPSNPRECFEMSVKAFDLAEQLQTPVVVLMDLEIGMNEWMCDPLEWDDAYVWNRGKVLDKKDLDALGTKNFYRYFDYEGDGLVQRTLPGTHPSKGSYFTRGSGHDKFGRYTEDATLYRENLDRISTKWKTSSKMVPESIWKRKHKTSDIGIVYFGSTEEAIEEALDNLSAHSKGINTFVIKSFPISQNFHEFLSQCKNILLVEQNRDAQMRTLIFSEWNIPAYNTRISSLLCYDGLPLTARHLEKKINEFLGSKPNAQNLSPNSGLLEWREYR